MRGKKSVIIIIIIVIKPFSFDLIIFFENSYTLMKFYLCHITIF